MERLIADAEGEMDIEAILRGATEVYTYYDATLPRSDDEFDQDTYTGKAA